MIIAIPFMRKAEAGGVSTGAVVRRQGGFLGFMGLVLRALPLCACLHLQAVTNEFRLVEFTNVWQSDLQASLPTTDWTTKKVWSWPRYRAPFGESNSLASINTPLPLPIKVTQYFRVPFQLPVDPSDLVDATLNHLLDDGAVIYLNGQEVARWNMPDGPVTSSTRALSSVTDPTVQPLSLPAGRFLPGENMLAVELHQAAAPQTTALFALELVVRAKEPRRLELTAEPEDVTILPGQPFSLLTSVEGSWPRFQWLKAGQRVYRANRGSYDVARAAPADAGDYQLIATNELNAVTSRVVRVTVALPTNGLPSLDRIGVDSSMTDGQPGALISEDTRVGGAWGVSASVFTFQHPGMVQDFSFVFFGREFNAGGTNNLALTTFEDFQVLLKVWTNGIADWWADPRGGLELDVTQGPVNPAPFGLTANPITGTQYPTFRHTVDMRSHQLRVAAGQSIVVAPVFRRDAYDKLVRLCLSTQQGPADLYAGFQGVTNSTTQTDLGFAQYATALTFEPDAATESPLTITEQEGGRWRIEMRGQAGKRYRLEVSETLLPGSWHEAQETTTGADGRVSFEEPAVLGQTHRYYRVAWGP